MRERSLRFAAALLPVLAALAWAPAAAADLDFGARGGFYNDAEAGFLGAEVLTRLTGSWYLNPNVEYAFVDNGSLWTLNADAHYDLPVRSGIAVWAGAGVAAIFREIDPPRGCPRCEGVDETDVGLNLLAGAGTKRGTIRPYVQGKIILSDETEAVIAVGLRFY